jgi:hypothetical protein
MGSIPLSDRFLGKQRQKSCTEPKQEDGRSDKANRDAPLENGGRGSFRRDLRHWAFQVHGPENYVHAVENHTDRGENCSNEQHSGTGTDEIQAESKNPKLVFLTVFAPKLGSLHSPCIGCGPFRSRTVAGKMVRQA